MGRCGACVENDSGLLGHIVVLGACDDCRALVRRAMTVVLLRAGTGSSAGPVAAAPAPAQACSLCASVPCGLADCDCLECWNSFAGALWHAICLWLIEKWTQRFCWPAGRPVICACPSAVL